MSNHGKNDRDIVKQVVQSPTPESSSRTSIRKAPLPSPAELGEYENNYRKGGLTKKYFDRYIEHDKEESKRADRVLLYSFIMTMSLFLMTIFLFILGKDKAAIGTLISAFVPLATTLIKHLPFGVKKQPDNKIEVPEVGNDDGKISNDYYNFEKTINKLAEPSPSDHALTNNERDDTIPSSLNKFMEPSGGCSNTVIDVKAFQAIKGLSHDTIQQGIQNGILITKSKILETLNCNESANLQVLYTFILGDLKKMQFKIIYTDALSNIFMNQSIPAITIFNTKDKKDGGSIKLNKNYSKPVLLEALFHEYIHIKDDSLPLFKTTQNTVINEKVYDELYKRTEMKFAEFRADMAAYALMMPPKRMQAELFGNAYDINKILETYNDFEKSSVLKWIALINPLPCHFAWLLLAKDKDNNIDKLLIHDNFYYDHISDPKLFDIDAVLANEDSAVARAIRSRANVHTVSNIHGIDYYCYAYYEANLVKDVIVGNMLGSQPVYYDRVLVIGWDKNILDMVRIMAQKEGGNVSAGLN
jgi:hypothetical protein